MPPVHYTAVESYQRHGRSRYEAGGWSPQWHDQYLPWLGDFLRCPEKTQNRDLEYNCVCVCVSLSTYQ